MSRKLRVPLGQGLALQVLFPSIQIGNNKRRALIALPFTKATQVPAQSDSSLLTQTRRSPPNNVGTDGRVVGSCPSSGNDREPTGSPTVVGGPSAWR